MKVYSVEKSDTFVKYPDAWLYNYDHKKLPDEEEREGGWECESVRVFEPLSANNITQQAIRDRWDTDYEQKLINEYNAAKLGLYSDDHAAKCINAYEAYLEAREALKKQIDADWEEFNNSRV